MSLGDVARVRPASGKSVPGAGRAALAVHLVGRFDVEDFEGFEDGVAGQGAELAATLGAGDDAGLLAAEDRLVGGTVVEGGGAGGDYGVELLLGGEVVEPGFAGEAAAFGAGGEVGLGEFGEAGDVALGDAEEEGVPRDVRGQEIVVGDEDGGDAGLHDLEETDAAGSGSAGAEDEVRGGEGFGVALLAGFAAGLVEVPVVVGAGVLY